MNVVWEGKGAKVCVQQKLCTTHNVQEEEKEYILRYHNEKLAIAFALVIY